MILRHRLLSSLGWLYAELGDLDHAVEWNRRRAEGARKRGDPETAKRPEASRAAYRAARAVVDDVLGRLANPALRASFAADLLVRHVRDLGAPD